MSEPAPPVPSASTSAAAPVPSTPSPAVPVLVDMPLPTASPPLPTQADLRKKLDNSRRELRMFLERRKRIDKELATLEASIYAFEGSYLSDALLPSTSSSSTQFGNIIKGYDSYLKAPPTGSDRKRGRGTEEPREGDRMFSRSSSTYLKALDLRSVEVMDSASEEESMGSSGTGRKRRK